MSIDFQAQYVYRRERGTELMIKLPIFKKRKCSCLYNNFVSVWVLETLFPSLNNGKSCKLLQGLRHPKTLHLHLEQSKLVWQWLAVLVTQTVQRKCIVFFQECFEILQLTFQKCHEAIGNSGTHHICIHYLDLWCSTTKKHKFCDFSQSNEPNPVSEMSLSYL